MSERSLAGPTAQTGRRAAFGFIFAAALINAVSFGIMIPILPNLIKQFTGGDTAQASEVNVLFAVTWGLMQFFCGPLLGLLSDRVGRRPVLLISLAGLAIDFLFMAFAPTLAWLFVGRVLNGLTAASFSTANAYVADVTAPEKRARAFGLMGSAFSFGFIGGPALGGYRSWRPPSSPASTSPTACSCFRSRSAASAAPPPSTFAAPIRSAR
jgi:DHA1 family tetracycline resistance protein-like MFS transporter